jgi:hypothetical protein
MKHKTKTRRFDEAKCCYSKALSANPRKIGPKCRKPRLKASPSSQLMKGTASKKEERNESVATTRLSPSSING